MIVNTNHRFIFVHIPKTGGTSISRLLKELSGNSRRIPHRATKHETLSEFFARIENGLWAIGPLRARRLRTYFQFGFVRNPWDRIASLYSYLVEHRPRPEIAGVRSFSEFLKRMEDGEPWICGLHSMRLQRDFLYAPDGTRLAHFVGRFETLSEDFEKACQRLALAGTLPHANRSSNADRDYRIHYTDEMAEIIQKRFAADIAEFGYRFDSPKPG